MWRFAVLGLVACTEHGQTRPGVDATSPSPSETAVFVPQICAGAPGTANCPVNQIPLLVGSTATFTVHAVSSGVVFPDLTFIAGQAGLVIINPKVVINGIATGPATVVDLAPGAAETLPSFSVVGAQVNSGMSLRFDSISTQP